MLSYVQFLKQKLINANANVKIGVKLSVLFFNYLAFSISSIYVTENVTKILTSKSVNVAYLVQIICKLEGIAN